MQNATAVACRDGYTDDEPVAYQLTDKAHAVLQGEQAEARGMIGASLATSPVSLPEPRRPRRGLRAL